MKVLVPTGLLDGAQYINTPADSGPFQAAPRLIVIHYTASGGTGLADAKFFERQAKSGASAHVVLGRDGIVYQCESFKNIAHHAGRSIWRGVPSCNAYSIGIEVDNWGILSRRADHTYRSWTGEVVPPENVVLLPHKARTTVDAWEIYPEPQLVVLDDLVRALIETYPTLKEVVGHEDVAPGRKIDPGPAFPMSRYWNILNRRDHDAPDIRTVWVETLNVRAGPGMQSAFMDWGPLKKNEKVTVINDTGDWSYIQIDRSGHTFYGWVFDQLLR